ncbi:MAG: hypothetical protein HQL06_12545 [Nitrospirae bacterium]|nr:hypothetical protein [Nitrospirota bacterium]
MTNIKKRHIFIVLFIYLFCCASTTTLEAQDSPEYDVNTEISLSGTIAQVSSEMRGPQLFTLQSEGKIYTVLTGPKWYLSDIGLILKSGMRVEVIGSKMYASDGRLHIITFSILNVEAQKRYQFRRNDMTPLWMGQRRGRGPHR